MTFDISQVGAAFIGLRSVNNSSTNTLSGFFGFFLNNMDLFLIHAKKMATFLAFWFNQPDFHEKLEFPSCFVGHSAVLIGFPKWNLELAPTF